jgi:hypothetical protein
MTEFSVILAKPWHCGQMARLLRSEHAQAIAMIGMDSHRELKKIFDVSLFRRVWLIDGALAGLGGVTGSTMSSEGFIWLALSNKARKYPVAVVKEARRQLAEIMEVKRELATTVLNGDTAAKRMAIFLGFHVSDYGPGAPASSREGRCRLSAYLEAEPDVRVPVGASFAIAMGYHREGHP